VRATTIFAYRFVSQNFFQLLRLSWVSLLLASVTLYATLEGYMAEVLVFLRTSDMRAASVALALITGGIVICLFFYAAIAVSAARLALSGMLKKEQGQALRSEWRLFAAHLRLLLCSLALFVIAVLLFGPVRAIVPWPTVSLLLVGVTGAALCWFFTRAGFLAPAVAASETGPILRRAWSLSRGHSWRIAIIIGALALPAVLLQLGGEVLLRASVSGPLLAPLTEQMTHMRQALPLFVCVLSFALFLNVLLVTAGCAFVYRSLVDAR
jgi:hypothetical protein